VGVVDHVVRRAADHDARGGRARRVVARRARGRDRRAGLRRAAPRAGRGGDRDGRYYGAPLRDGLDVSGFLVLLAAGAVLAAAGAAFFERRDLGR
jgi:hypothetical protein